jgi:microcin C transport system permease protein
MEGLINAEFFVFGAAHVVVIGGVAEGGDKILYGHVFRNAMLIVFAGFPAAFVGAAQIQLQHHQ